MKRLSQFFSKMFKGKPKPETVTSTAFGPYEMPVKFSTFKAPEPDKGHLPDLHKKELFSWPHRVGFGTFRRLKPICGHSVRPLNRHQKRDLSKLFGEKIL